MESDESDANHRGERLLRCLNPWQRYWPRLHVDCHTHKVHTSAVKAMEVLPFALSLAMNLALCSISPGMMAQARRILDNIADGIEVKQGQPLLSGIAFRARTVAQFCPANAAARAHLHIISLFNDGWRPANKLVHVCGGCCVDVQAAVTKAKLCSRLLLRLARPKVTSRNIGRTTSSVPAY